MGQKFIVEVSFNGGSWQRRGQHRRINGAQAEIDQMQAARNEFRRTKKAGDGVPDLQNVSVQIVSGGRVVQTARKLK